MENEPINLFQYYAVLERKKLDVYVKEKFNISQKTYYNYINGVCDMPNSFLQNVRHTFKLNEIAFCTFSAQYNELYHERAAFRSKQQLRFANRALSICVALVALVAISYSTFVEKKSNFCYIQDTPTPVGFMQETRYSIAQRDFLIISNNGFDTDYWFVF